MTNDILFRGFHPYPKGKTVINIGNKKRRGDWIYWDMFGHCKEGFVEKLNNGEFIAHFVKPNNVIESTISQFISTDKNDKKVFIGDYITTRFGRVCEVILLNNDENKCADLIPIANVKDGKDDNSPSLWDLWHKDNIEVVGNIYENPDMKYGG